MKEYQFKNDLLKKELTEASMRLTSFTTRTHEEPSAFERLAMSKQSTARTNASLTSRMPNTNRDTMKGSITLRSSSLRK
jgi:hypothetical protein